MSDTTTPTPAEAPKHGTREYFDTLTKEDPENRNLEGISKKDQAEAASAHARINIPLNLNNWKDQPDDVQAQLLWFHQWILDNEIGWKAAKEALGMDQSTIFRILKGTYSAGSWNGIMERIQSFRKLLDDRSKIIVSEFRPNRVSRKISAVFDYARSTNTIALVIGESRTGKSVASRDWKERNNHGRTILVEVPPVGGSKALLLQIAKQVGVNQNTSVPVMLEAVVRAFNKNRMLIVDEFHRCLSSSKAATPWAIEVVRYIHDKTGASIGLIATQRFSEAIKGASYQYEQLVGRIGMSVLIHNEMEDDDILPIVTQYIAKPSPELMEKLLAIANAPGRLGVMSETLKVASKVASSAKAKLKESHVLDAIAIREQMGTLKLAA